MPRHSCRGALFWSFRYGYATLLESWRHSLPHVQPADPAGRRCRVAVLPPAAQSPGRKPRPDRAGLPLWGSGGIGGRKIPLPAAPAAPAAPGPPPCWQPIRPPFPPATSRVGSSFMAGCSALWPRFGCSAGGARSPSPSWGPTWSPPSPCFTPLAGWAASWPGAATAFPPPPAGRG